MTRIAITGHRGLPPATTQLVDEAIRAALDQYEDVVGITCLADGADQLFAQAVLDTGGRIEIIIPATQYRASLPAEAHPTYDRLLGQATTVQALDHVESEEQAHMHASTIMLDNADHLFAVWDGKPARGYGGTADVVALAHERAMPVTRIWPQGANRN